MSYGELAVDCVREFVSLDKITNPVDKMKQIWDNNSRNRSLNEPCPKSTFLGLCSAGCISGIPAGNYTGSIKNRLYGETAVKLLKDFPPLGSQSEDDLWELVTKIRKSYTPSVAESHHCQMNIVLALWKAGFIA